MKRLLVCVVLVAAGLVVAQTITIKVKETRVRSSPRFYAKSIYDAKSGDRLQKIGELQGWYKVVTPDGETGWVHSSAVETRKLELSSGEWVEQEASPDEVALAGKGFNEEVEAEYRKTHQELDYTLVDRMEKIEVTDSEMLEFLREGRLGEYGGGR
ncbi:hypothetical protein AMJ40_05450 [candidate division TA06 bacterium DG_26]|uniref:SH3b domain-containing protein n=1 Tax=candidate division TA06 bacterium DG_26 TaxID=1703771 RepID=A0A0S7WH25_UNCT6|nr:MAG: hypothetical protein AMJ40_05450 [candidate division TA06 bacterium DG_26]